MTLEQVIQSQPQAEALGRKGPKEIVPWNSWIQLPGVQRVPWGENTWQ